jgi:hypothetical protein
LVTIGGNPPEWLALGATKGGVTLSEIGATKIVVDTATGFKEVRLWAPDVVASGSAPGGVASTPSAPPSGLSTLPFGRSPVAK